MLATIITLAGGAGIVAFLHTVAGPDHYVPFVALAAASRWPVRKLILITLLCGIGHVCSSILLGLLGASMGWAVADLEAIQSCTGAIVGWALMGLGIVWLIYGLYVGLRSRAHGHVHALSRRTLSRVMGENVSQGHVHSQTPDGVCQLTSINEQDSHIAVTTPWILLIIFVLGPCEPLIAYTFPLGLERNLHGFLLVSSVFSAVTIATMLTVVLFGYYGLMKLQSKILETYIHFFAGLAIFLSGFAINFLGL